MTIDQIIASVSALAAVVSAAFAAYSLSVAKRALLLAAKERELKDGAVSVYLQNIFRVGSRSVIAQLRYTNESELADSISHVELLVHYLVDGAMANAVLPCVVAQEKYKGLGEFNPVLPPISIGARSSESIWVAFELPDRVLELNNRIDGYVIESRIASGSYLEVKARIVGEMQDAE